MGKINREECNVEVVDIEPFDNDEYKGFKIVWSGNVGFGEYSIYQGKDDAGIWRADSECMDSPDDKWFIKKLMDNFIEQLQVSRW